LWQRLNSFGNFFEDFAPELYRQLKQISDAVDTPDYERVLAEVYPQIEKISFDNAVLKRWIQNLVMLFVDLEWSDIGAWKRSKKPLKAWKDNVIKGNALVEDSRDTLVFNSQTISCRIDMNDMVIVNTDDVILVCPKLLLPKIKKLVESLEGNF